MQPTITRHANPTQRISERPIIMQGMHMKERECFSEERAGNIFIGRWKVIMTKVITIVLYLSGT